MGARVYPPDIEVRRNTGVPSVGIRPRLNFIEGAYVGIAVTDDPAGNEIDIEVSADGLLTALWGDGSDGDLVQAGGVATITGPMQYESIALSAGAVFGPANDRFAIIKCRGLLSLVGNSTIQARWVVQVANGGASRNTVGVGNAADRDPYRLTTYGTILPTKIIGGNAGIGGGGGGGGAVNVGGYNGQTFKNQHAGVVGSLSWDVSIFDGRYVRVVGAGTPGDFSGAPPVNADFGYYDAMAYVGSPSCGGGGGGVDNIGTGVVTAVSGTGGDGGYAGGYLNIRAQYIEIEAGSSINADGENGIDGTNAVDSTNADGEAGGGGAGGGGGGGSVWILCCTIDNPGNVTVTGGTGGTSGTGLPTAGGAGGDGGNGGNGIVAITTIPS